MVERARNRAGAGRRIRTVMLALFSLTLLAALATPHIVDNHLFSLSAAATQSIVLAIDLTLAGLFFGVYLREMRREEREKASLHTRLLSSFRYIGQANVSLELTGEFARALAGVHSRREANEIFRSLHRSIAVSVAGATASRIRLIATHDGRTVAEFVWTEDGAGDAPAISNRDVLEDRPSARSLNGEIFMRSDYMQTGVICALAAAATNGDVRDTELLRTLVNQFHLLFLLARKELGK